MNARDRNAPFTFGDAPPPEGEPHHREPRSGGHGRVLAVVLLLALLGGAAAAVWHFQPAPVMEWLRGTPLAPAAAVTRAYKWRDTGGGWQITDAPPPEGTPYEVIEVSSDTNVLPLPPALQAD